jgi:hypothetical protein
MVNESAFAVLALGQAIKQFSTVANFSGIAGQRVVGKDHLSDRLLNPDRGIQDGGRIAGRALP